MQLNRLSRIIVGATVGTAMVSVALGALAQTPPPVVETVTSYAGIVSFIKNVVGGWLFGILIALAVIFIIWAAFLNLTAGGDEEKVKKAKSMIVYALIAVAIALLAKGLVILIASLFGEQVSV